MKKAVRFNEEIALEVFGILDRTWREKIGIFKDAVLALPQNRYSIKKSFPLLSDRDFANWFFFLALPMRGGIKSDYATKLWLQIISKYPSLIHIETVVRDWPPKRIIKTLQEFNANYQDKQHAENWYNNAKNLLERWEGDIRNVFEGISNFEEVFARVDYKSNPKTGFRGMRRKIFNLCKIWLEEQNLIKISPGPIPVDFHALRILWSTEIINLDNWAVPFKPRKEKQKPLEGKIALRIWESVIDQIMIWSEKFLQKYGFSHLVINPAIWTLGEALCGRNFQNSFRTKTMTYVETDELQKNPNLWAHKKNYCGFCVIERWCKWRIPSGPHYRWGILARVGRRLSHPSPNLAGINWPEEEFYHPLKGKNGAD
jgi:hypothetical protein